MISNIEAADIDIRFSTLCKIKKVLRFKADNWSRIYSFSLKPEESLFKIRKEI